jgi:hypothetical protein
MFGAQSILPKESSIAVLPTSTFVRHPMRLAGNLQRMRLRVEDKLVARHLDLKVRVIGVDQIAVLHDLGKPKTFLVVEVAAAARFADIGDR